MRQTLVIDNVDFELLERQRLALWRVINFEATVSDEQLIQGLANMLDAWSDTEYFKEGVQKNGNL